MQLKLNQIHKFKFGQSIMRSKCRNCRN